MSIGLVHPELWGWRDRPPRAPVWEPHALTHEEWPPNYRAVYGWRMQQLKRFREDPEYLASALAYYARKPVQFIMHWIDTYDPRRPVMKWIPFVFFAKQEQFINFVHECRTDGENGLVEKCRDGGMTWGACAYSVWSWRFIADDAIGWGSRKQDLVDTLGNPDSIFEKMRLIIRRLPPEFLPNGYNPKFHATFMKLINPENGAVIMGEAGDGIGRGGRTALYFKDEAAHYERPEKIESALGDNTNVQIDISSVNGLGNVFHRRREAGIEWEPGKRIETGYTRVFIMDWSDHPAKNLEWYNRRKDKAVREGLMHVFAQEVERNYAAAVQNVVIDGEWIKAAIDADKKIKWLKPEMLGGVKQGALDVADEGLDRNAYVDREGIKLVYTQEWGERDPGVTSRNTIGLMKERGVSSLQYDCIGIGATVKSEINRLGDDKVNNPLAGLSFTPWNAGGAVLNPFDHLIEDDEETPLNRNFFHNVKAQAWWSLRTRFYKTWRAVMFGDVYPIEELIIIDGSVPNLRQLEKELAQPTTGYSSNLKTLINKKPDGTKSPNIADAVCMVYFPLPMNYSIAEVGTYGNV